MNKNNIFPQIDDLVVFLAVIRRNSFSGAARELGQSNAHISKRIHILEKTLGTPLFYRSTRTLKLTATGEFVQQQALDIVEKMEKLMINVGEDKHSMIGNLHICSSFGFGRKHLSQPLALFAKEYPNLSLELTLTDHKNDLIKENIDLEISVGNSFNERYFARKLVSNKRILCASSSYIEKYGMPTKPADLINHQCLFLKEKESAFGLWKLFDGKQEHLVTVKGGMTTNNGEVILQWALEGSGIIYRSIWDAQQYLTDGRLIHILPSYYEDASVWAVHPYRLSEFRKTEVCVNYLADYFSNKRFE